MYHSQFFCGIGKKPNGHTALIVLDSLHANIVTHLETSVFQTPIINIHGST